MTERMGYELLIRFVEVATACFTFALVGRGFYRLLRKMWDEHRFHMILRRSRYYRLD